MTISSVKSFIKKHKEGIIVAVISGVIIGVILSILKFMGLSLLHILTIFFATHITLSLWFVVLLFCLSAYTVFVFMRSIMIARATKPFEQNGFLWKSSWWPLDPPYPICKGCGELLRVEHRILSEDFSSRYYFNCGDPRHRPIVSILPLEALQREALKDRKKIREELKKQPKTWFRKSA